MTATFVNGLEVVADDPVLSPLSTPENPIFYKRIRLLLLSDGTTVYGCTECDVTGTSMPHVRSHLRVHNEPKPHRAPKSSAPPPLNGAGSMTLAEVVDLAHRMETQAQHIGRLMDDRDHWRERAKKAEKALDVLRKALSL